VSKSVGEKHLPRSPQPVGLPSAKPAQASAWSVSRAKRCLDIAAASTALIFFAPLMVTLGILVRCTSSGPILFRQKRVGRLGRLFTIYKFRSMKIEREQAGPGHTKDGDSRLTAMGAALRRYKLDELPQFYNVLIGDMSLVGPRPKLPGHESMYMPFLPGITSAATLAFRREEEMLRDVPDQEIEYYYATRIRPVKHRLDSEYMEQSTISSDMQMLLRTVTACFVKDQPSTLELLHGEGHGTAQPSQTGKYYVVSKAMKDTESLVGSD
jgi:lipopolysaccharide/colanic/teichoic acid biosynthesis glycosyltransferase